MPELPRAGDQERRHQQRPPLRARVFLDAGANCACDPTEPIEEAVCFALKRYGAFATDSSGSRFAIGFEGPSTGQPGGSGPSPYSAGGLPWDFYDMRSIPWSHLHVAGGARRDRR